MVVFVARRWWLVVGVLMGVLATPGIASAAQSFSVSSPSGGSFQAGSDSDYTTTINFDTSAGAPQSAIVAITPGVLASLAANPSCVQTTQHTDPCKIGDGTATITGGASVTTTAYLVPPTDKANDVVGIDILTNPALTAPTHAEVKLHQTASGNVQSLLNIDLSGSGGIVTSTSLTVHGTLGGKPFNHMPTNCAPGPSSLTVTYGTGSSQTSEQSPASPDFTITGCDSLPYAPQLSATAVKDATDSGVLLTTTITQAVGEADSAGNALRVPFPALGPNTNSLSLQNSGIAVGLVTAYSPLLPDPLQGKVYLTGSSAFSPTLTLRFPPPNSLTLVGSVNLQTSTVTFTGLPDVPQTKLVVTLFGGPKALESASCTPGASGGIVSGTFTAQSGKVAHASQFLNVVGCPGPPTLSRFSLSGLPSGKPVLRFTLNKGPSAPKLKSFSVSLPGGLSFNPRGLGAFRGASAVQLQGGKLTVTLKRAVNSVTVTLSPPLLVESKRLQQQARRHKLPQLRFRFGVSDTNGTTTSLSASA